MTQDLTTLRQREMEPRRIQLSRAKGFNLQQVSMALNGRPAVNVARPSIFGNVEVCARPYGCTYHPLFEQDAWGETWEEATYLRCCVDVYRHYVETGIRGEPTRSGRLGMACEAMAGYPRRTKLVAALPRLTGKNLACWCALDRPCHAAVLLEVANDPALLSSLEARGQ